MSQPIATIIRKTPVCRNHQPDIVSHWTIETATASVRIRPPEFGEENPKAPDNPGGIELIREDTGETILCPFNEKNSWIILARVPDPESRPDETEKKPMEFPPFSTNGILALRQLATEPENQQEARQWLATIRAWRDCIYDLHARVPDWVQPEYVTTVLSETYLDKVRAAELPQGVTAAGLARLVMANELKLKIANLREDDALAATNEWIGNLGAVYQPMPGSSFRAPILAEAHGDNDDHNPIRRQIAQLNDGLVRDVFATLTSCLPENMTAGVARCPSGDLLDRLQEAGALEVTAFGNSEWGPTVRDHIQTVLDQYFDGKYQPDCRLYVTPNDQDVLVVGDHEASYFYSWPSVTRAQIIDRIDGTPVVTALGEQIPTAEEVLSLQDELDTLLDLQDGMRPEPDHREDHQPERPQFMS